MPRRGYTVTAEAKAEFAAIVSGRIREIGLSAADVARRIAARGVVPEPSRSSVHAWSTTTSMNVPQTAILTVELARALDLDPQMLLNVLGDPAKVEDVEADKHHDLSLSARADRAEEAIRQLRADVDRLDASVKSYEVALPTLGGLPLPHMQVDVLDQLAKLGQLRDAGVLTDGEFTAKKTDLLGRL